MKILKSILGYTAVITALTATAVLAQSQMSRQLAAHKLTEETLSKIGGAQPISNLINLRVKQGLIDYDAEGTPRFRRDNRVHARGGSTIIPAFPPNSWVARRQIGKVPNPDIIAFPPAYEAPSVNKKFTPSVQGNEAGADRKYQDVDVDAAAFPLERASFSAEAVHGTDERRRVQDFSSTRFYPFSTVAKVYSNFPGLGWFKGTGTMISAEHVLTAGHMVYDFQSDTWASEIIVVPGMNGDEAPFGEAKGAYIRTYDGWFNGFMEHNFAVVTLDSKLGKETGWMGFLPATDQQLKKTLARAAGYPNDIDDGEIMVEASGPFKAPKAFLVSHDVDTENGESGGPLFNYVRSYPAIFAVHAQDGTPLNFGVRINAEKYRSIYNWIRTGK